MGHSCDFTFDLAFQVSQYGKYRKVVSSTSALCIFLVHCRGLINVFKKCWSQLMTWLYGAGPATCCTAVAQSALRACSLHYCRCI